MKRFLLILLNGFGISALHAQSVRYSMAQTYTGLSAYSILQNDAMSFTGNPAALAQTTHAGAGVFGERRFMLKENSAYTLGAAFPTRLGNLGLQLNYAGFANFNEINTGLAYAKRLGKWVDVGAQFNYYRYAIPAYGNASTFHFALGLLLHVTDKLHAGIHVYNPVGGRLGKSSSSNPKPEKIASAYKMGMGYDASDKFFIATEVVKEEDKPVNVVCGLQYRFAKQFFARAGFLSESSSLFAGAGMSWKNLRLDVSAGYHPRLGFSPGLLLLLNFKKKAQ